MKSYWYPVSLSKALKNKPIRVILDNQNIVLFRHDNGIGALADRCPHRSAPLSKGKVIGESVQCPYHGWAFGASGKLTDLPLYEGTLPRCKVPRFDAIEKNGLIFITKEAQNAQPIFEPIWDGQDFIQQIWTGEVVSPIADIAENIMDPVHTIFVHNGLIRGLGESKTSVDISTSIIDGEVIMHYAGEKEQNGLLSKLLEGERQSANNRFTKPGVISLEYQGARGLSLVTTFYFQPIGNGKHKGYALFRGPKSYGLGYLKLAIFSMIMRRVIAQDIEIMENSWANSQQTGGAHFSGPVDVVRPHIDALLSGKNLDARKFKLNM